MIILLDLTQSWNDSWVEKDDERSVFSLCCMKPVQVLETGHFFWSICTTLPICLPVRLPDYGFEPDLESASVALGLSPIATADTVSAALVCSSMCADKCAMVKCCSAMPASLMMSGKLCGGSHSLNDFLEPRCLQVSVWAAGAHNGQLHWSSNTVRSAVLALHTSRR